MRFRQIKRISHLTDNTASYDRVTGLVILLSITTMPLVTAAGEPATSERGADGSSGWRHS